VSIHAISTGGSAQKTRSNRLCFSASMGGV
jgi:hypothetical protein